MVTAEKLRKNIFKSVEPAEIIAAEMILPISAAVLRFPSVPALIAVPALIKSIVTEPVIKLSLFRILQYLISLGQLLELVFGSFIVLICIRVIFFASFLYADLISFSEAVLPTPRTS